MWRETPDKIGPRSQWQCGPSCLTSDPATWPVKDILPTKEERETVKSYKRVTKTCVASSKLVTDLHILYTVILRSGRRDMNGDQRQRGESSASAVVPLARTILLPTF